MSVALTVRGDFAALQAFLEKAADLADRSPAFEAALGTLDLNDAVLTSEAGGEAGGASGGQFVVVARPAPRWVDLFRRHGGVWP